MPAALQLLAPGGIGEIRPGCDLASEILTACAGDGLVPQAGDILIVAQKIVSKAEGRLVALDEVAPSAEARTLALKAGKDARIVELILRESSAVLRCVPGVIIVRHRHGTVLANAGIDQSNVLHQDGREYALLWPADPDAAAAGLRQAMLARLGFDLPVIINDSLGRAWRFGTVGAAIGVSGLAALVDMRGEDDRHGRVLVSTEVGQADEIAAAASLLMGQAAEGRPVVFLRGYAGRRNAGSVADLIRPPAKDLFP
ncbi:coenzyme F420-0:L-glutamate ligase [Ferrovibrio sp.]|uniref:coenzyme F420-0:L-glutamate ligase n=1 Tax=Ferrovibrio sp. TaxID=1917215 RepID=UPI001B699DB8|nr:coenzyme F420-0:L-glutamate ligase [Ferrovibrio sp.]MBP7063283.1 coenzyme F420-0:L-glutamate ligase [Ferrovibrio sp.]